MIDEIATGFDPVIVPEMPSEALLGRLDKEGKFLTDGTTEEPKEEQMFVLDLPPP